MITTTSVLLSSRVNKCRLSVVTSMINSVIALTLISCLSACTSSEPYRTNLVGCDTTMACPNPNLEQWCKEHNPSEEVQECIKQHTTPEKNEKYTLHFVEFDDQGWLPQKDGEEQKYTGNASKQLDFLMRSLYAQAGEAKNGVSVVVYVHGWHHSAKFDDENVASFRELLLATKDQEKTKLGGGKDVVGIYVGWRGDSTDSSLLKYFTFWDRKNTAIHVAEGSTRELFARIHEFQKRINKAKQQENKHFVRTLYIGHSFGAQVVFFSISNELIASVAGTNDQIQDDKRKLRLSNESTDSRMREKRRFLEMERPADMVLLINPAFEAARYEPLHKAANCATCNYPSYIPPLLVIVTSDADTATKDFFWLGRIINSVFERPFSSEEQSRAVTHTPGFMDDQTNYQYVTHRLDMQTKFNPHIAGTVCPMNSNLDEFAKNNSYYFDGTKWQDKDDGWMRNFCGVLDPATGKLGEGTSLKHNIGLDPNSPIWNVGTTEEIIKNHNDIAEPVFKSFVQQLYHDLVLFNED